MSKKIAAYKALKKTSYKLDNLKDEIKELKKTKVFSVDNLWDILDRAAVNDAWRNQFARTYSTEYYGKANPEFIKKFKVFSEDEKDEIRSQYACVTLNGEVSSKVQREYLAAIKEAKKLDNAGERIAKFQKLTKSTERKFDIDADNVLETNVLPVIDGLLNSTALLERVNMISGVDYKKLLEFSAEKDAETLTNTNAGTGADDTIRPGLTLATEDKKIQASTTINDTDLESLDASEWAKFIFRLGNRVQTQAEYQIIYGDATNNGFQRGFINSVGANDDNRIGALEVDTTEGGDIIEKMKLMDDDMPNDLNDADERQLIYLGNRKLHSSMRLAKDANSRYYFPEGTKLSVNGYDVIKSSSVVTGDLLLIAPPQYTLVDRSNGISLLNDGGVVELKEGNVIFVAKAKMDGCPRFAHKYVYTDTPATTTSGDPNNQNRNKHRFTQNAY